MTAAADAAGQGDYPDPATRRMITISVVAATIMVTLDSTIANVALPHIQGSISASAEEISWVLTSYIVAAAICTPLAGWLAGRIGRKRLMLYSVIGFTFASLLCGAATSITQLVLFRLLQGMFGASLMPMSHATLLDINPPSRYGAAMAAWGMSSMLGPITGPALGGWLTDNFSWRWVFYINLPVGIATAIGIAIFVPARRIASRPFDLFGFAMLALAIGCFQLMLDRGQTKDWLSAPEIRIEAVGALLFVYLFLAHTLTARRPFVDPGLFRDRNFAIGLVMGFFIYVVVFSVLALLPPMLETLMGYPVVLTGMVTAPRGAGMMAAMIIVGRLIARFGPRTVILAGLMLVSSSMYYMAGFNLAMDSKIIALTGLIQGFGAGMIFVPLTTLSFLTLSPAYINEGTAMFTLFRMLGQSAGIAVLQTLWIRNSAIVHARLTEFVRPDNPLLANVVPGFDFDLPEDVARVNQMITRQAQMVSYVDIFWTLSMLSLALAPLLIFMRGASRGGPPAELAVALD